MTQERGGATGLTYRDAGVDIAAATTAVDRIKAHAASTLGAAAAPIGHFGGVYRLPAGEDRLLVASADGIGTKLKLAFLFGGSAHRRVSADLVNHCVNDILALGARPLFFLDYFATSKVDPDTIELVVAGIADACRENGMALIGGETAEMPGFYGADEYDVAGFIVGEVAPGSIVDGAAIEPGDVLLGLPSVGLHTNGYSLARRIVGLTGDREVDLRALDQPLPDSGGQTVGEALLAPHLSYLAAIQPTLEAGLVRGMAHITGGGLLDNVPRMLRPGLVAAIDRTTWSVPPIFTYLVQTGDVPESDRYQALNMGIGFVLATARSELDRTLSLLPGAIVIGEVESGQDRDADPFVRWTDAPGALHG